MTTCPERRADLLPRTLASLCAGGFPSPRLFVDGVAQQDVPGWEAEFRLPVTARSPRVRAYANWLLALWELYLRQPQADLYMVAQDDFVCVRNLRAYLERNPPPPQSYGNLYLFPSNQSICPHDGKHVGWYESNQMGKGAVALVFGRAAVAALLTSEHLVARAVPKSPGDERCFKAIDGGVVTALRKAGFTEYVHYPSLTQHLGDTSTVGNPKHLKAPSFPGEDWDALTLLPSPPVVVV